MNQAGVVPELANLVLPSLSVGGGGPAGEQTANDLWHQGHLYQDV